MKQSSKEIMMSAVADWRHRGLIDGALQTTLATRYDTPNSFSKALLQWLGLGAIFLLGLGVFGLIAVLSGSPGVAAVLMGIGAVATWRVGVKMATDPLNSY